MATGDKRIHQLTQIVNAPSNGVLPIDVPGNTETNGITVDNLARTMPVATHENNGLLSNIFYGCIFNSPVSNTYTEGENQIPTSDIDGSSGQVPLGAYYINPDPNCSLFGKGDGMLITLRRSFLTAQLYFTRSGSLYLRTSPDYANFNYWKQISFT